MRREIERLLKQADRDVENARKNLGIQAYEVAAFLAQQAVEKYLKGTCGLELLCYTPEEFDERRQELGIVRVALEEGIAL